MLHFHLSGGSILESTQIAGSVFASTGGSILESVKGNVQESLGTTREELTRVDPDAFVE